MKKSSSNNIKSMINSLSRNTSFIDDCASLINSSNIERMPNSNIESFSKIASEMAKKITLLSDDSSPEDLSFSEDLSSEEEPLKSRKHYSKTIQQEKADLEFEKLKLRQEKQEFEDNITQQFRKEARKQNEEKYLEIEKINFENEKKLAEFSAKCIKNMIESEECCICLDNCRDTVLVPCGHKMFCYSCITEHCGKKKGKCPICKSDVTTFVKVFD